MKIFKQEEIEIIISNSSKPRALSNISYPLNSLDDRLFEILTYSIFKKRLHNGDRLLKKRFDDVVLMQGVGERGIDCYLKHHDKIASVIQCKKYAKNLQDSIVLADLIKFCLHLVQDASKFDLSKKFTYYIATSTGFTGKTNLLYATIKNKNIGKTYGFESLVANTIRKYSCFETLSAEIEAPKVIKLVKSFDYQLLGPNDYNLWINDYEDIISTFFEIKKVTDNQLLETKTKEILDSIHKLKPAANISKFLKDYANIAKEKLNTVNFIGFDIQRHRQRPEDITLTDLFVQPSFRQKFDEKNEKVSSVIERELTITNLFKSDKNIIILGDPGAGKSLLVKFLIVFLLDNKAEKLGLKQFANYTPIRIELRKYVEKGDNKSITEYLSENFKNEYQLNITNEELDCFLENYPTLLFFDGLDEIFNISHKAKVKEAIEAFSTRYIFSKCIVTSRFIGYKDVKFNQKKFDEFAILKFDKFQIKELVVKFYNTQHSSLEKKRAAAESCLKQIEDDVDSELKSNPLILTLILILASNNIVIPDSKLEIYESCTKTLVDSLDTAAKGLKIELSVSNKNFTFCHLAHWQYESQSKSKEITFEKAKIELAQFLINRQESLDFKDAEGKAEKFLVYAESRSIYFENNFTHKTFLEYFTAEYLYSTCIAKASDIGRKKLIRTVSEYLPSSFWYIVFELLFSRIDNFQPDNELLDEILSSQLTSNSLDVFYFLIANLTRLKNISKEIRKQIINRTILLCIKGEKLKNVLKRSYIFEDNSIISKLNTLLKDSPHFFLVQEVITDFEYAKLSEKQLIELYNLYFEMARVTSNAEVAKNKLVVKNRQQLIDLANKDLLLYSHVNFEKYKRNQKISIQVLLNQIENFGHKSLFTYIPLRHSGYSQRVDTFDLFLTNIIEVNDIEAFQSDLKQLLDFGLKIDAITEHLKSNRLFYYVRSENLEKILKLYLKSTDNVIDKILTTIISRGDNKMEVAYSRFRNEFGNHPKLKIIDRIFYAKQSVADARKTKLSKNINKPT